MIVVDVNVIAYLWIPGAMTELAEQAFRKDPLWATSLLWRFEFRNILAGYMRRKQMDEAAALRCLRGAEAQLQGHEFLVSGARVMNHVRRSSCSAYDCECVALAEDLGGNLVTCDRQLLRAFPGRTLPLREFATTP